MKKQEIYCSYCESEFVIESFNMASVNFCPNCGTEGLENDSDIDEDEYEEDED